MKPELPTKALGPFQDLTPYPPLLSKERGNKRGRRKRTEFCTLWQSQTPIYSYVCLCIFKWILATDLEKNPSDIKGISYSPFELKKEKDKMKERISLRELDLSLGKRTKLHRLLYKYGPANGTLLLLPIDQGLEHGPVDFFDNPDSVDPLFQLKLAKEGGYSGIVFHIGLAEKYLKGSAGEVPLILKLNGKTNIPSDKYTFSPQTASVEDAVRLGADAVGYTLYVGSPAQGEDIRQFFKIREDCDKFGMPLIMWAYPRGEAIEAKGGRDSLYAVDYAARVACELGADLVKLNLPEYDEQKAKDLPKPYDQMKFTAQEGLEKVAKSAGRTLVLVSGGSKISDEDLLDKVKACMEAGVTGLIFGRNMWQRKFEDALKLTEKIKRIMSEYSV
jgi:class I fructose-bisphosphate aldolase